MRPFLTRLKHARYVRRWRGPRFGEWPDEFAALTPTEKTRLVMRRLRAEQRGQPTTNMPPRVRRAKQQETNEPTLHNNSNH
jgi:hypothetical protein